MASITFPVSSNFHGFVGNGVWISSTIGRPSSMWLSNVVASFRCCIQPPETGMAAMISDRLLIFQQYLVIVLGLHCDYCLAQCRFFAVLGFLDISHCVITTGIILGFQWSRSNGSKLSSPNEKWSIQYLKEIRIK